MVPKALEQLVCDVSDLSSSLEETVMERPNSVEPALAAYLQAQLSGIRASLQQLLDKSRERKAS